MGSESRVKILCKNTDRESVSDLTPKQGFGAFCMSLRSKTLNPLALRLAGEELRLLTNLYSKKRYDKVHKKVKQLCLHLQSGVQGRSPYYALARRV